MNKYTLDLAGLNVESFQIQQPTSVEPIAQPTPETYQTDAAQQSICFVSCGGTCGC
jgi:hypothetical protein